MINKRLFNIIKTFDKKEFSEFEKFVSSPYFSRGRNVILLLKYLKKLHPDYPSEKTSLELMHKKIYPDKKYSEAAIRMQLSALSGLCKDYLQISHYLKKPREVKFNLLDELQNRNIDDIFSAEIKLLSKDIESEKRITIENINSRIKLHALNITRLGTKGDYTRITELLASAGEYVTIDFLVTLISNVQDIISFRNSYIMKRKKGLSEELIENIDFEKFIKVISERKTPGYELVLFYYYRLRFYTTNGNHSFFEKIKEIVYKSHRAYSHNEVYGMLVNMVNCCWWQIKNGNDKYRNELFGIYKFWIESDFFTDPKSAYLDIQLFKNIFNLALSLNELIWSEKFLKDYSAQLNPEHSHDTIHYSYALLYYAQKEYNKSLEMLKKTEYKDYIYKMECQSLTLRIYFDTDSGENLFSLADTYLHFLNRNKNENPAIVQRHLNFVKAIVKLQKIKSNFSGKKLDSLKLLIVKEKLITSKDWLLQKIFMFKK